MHNSYRGNILQRKLIEQIFIPQKSFLSIEWTLLSIPCIVVYFALSYEANNLRFKIQDEYLQNTLQLHWENSYLYMQHDSRNSHAGCNSNLPLKIHTWLTNWYTNQAKHQYWLQKLPSSEQSQAILIKE